MQRKGRKKEGRDLAPTEKMKCQPMRIIREDDLTVVERASTDDCQNWSSIDERTVHAVMSRPTGGCVM